MSGKVKKLAEMINFGASSMSLYRKRDYYRHVTSINAEQRWQELGMRLRESTNKVVNGHQ